MYPSYGAGRLLPRERPRGPGPVEIPAVAPSHSPCDGVFADVPSPAKSDRIPSTSSAASWVVTNEPAAQQVFGVDQVSHGELVLARKDPPEQCVSLGTSPSVFTVPPSLPALSPVLWIPLSFFGEERFQVQMSDTAAADLDMKSCVLKSLSATS